MPLNPSITSSAVALLSRLFVVKPQRQAEEICSEKCTIRSLDITQFVYDAENTVSEDFGRSADDHVPGSFPNEMEDSQETLDDRLYMEYLQKQREIGETLRLAQQTSKDIKEQLHRLRDAKHTTNHNQNGMAGPAPGHLAFGASITFLNARSGMDLYGSAVPNDSPIRSSTASTKKFSHYDSAPGSRWSGRLSGEQNCGFAGGGKSGLRRDAVNEQEQREVQKTKKTGEGRRSRFAVPTGLQEAMRKGQVINIDVKKESDGVQDGRFDDGDIDDEWLTEDEDEDVPGGKTEGLSNVRIKRRAAEMVDDLIVRQVGVKKWSLDEHMRKKGIKRRG